MGTTAKSQQNQKRIKSRRRLKKKIQMTKKLIVELVLLCYVDFVLKMFLLQIKYLVCHLSVDLFIISYVWPMNLDLNPAVKNLISCHWTAIVQCVICIFFGVILLEKRRDVTKLLKTLNNMNDYE